MVIELKRVLDFKYQKKIKLYPLFKKAPHSSLPCSFFVNSKNTDVKNVTPFTSTLTSVPSRVCTVPITQFKQKLAISGSGKTVGLKDTFKEKTNAVLQALNVVVNHSRRSLILSKTIFPQTCINIFVHFSEKTNLLFRSENKTEFSARKILQTTTI